MRSTPVAGIALLAVVLATAGCSQAVVSSDALTPSETAPESEAPSTVTPASASIETSPGASGDPAITFEAVKPKRWGAKPFNVKATASTGAKIKFSAKGSCTVRTNSGKVEIQEVGDCVITAKTASGEPASESMTITVGPAKPKITFAGKSVRWERPFSYTLKAKVSPKIPLAFTLVGAGSGEDCKVSNGKLTLTGRQPNLEADCKVKVAAAKTSANYETPKPVVATIHVRYPSWDVEAVSPDVVQYETSDGEVRVTVRERSGDALGIDAGVTDGPVVPDGPACNVKGVSPDPAPPATTKYVVVLSVADPKETETPEGYDCTVRVHALPPDYSCCVGGTKSDVFTVTVKP
jgi:hypothetical protein